MNERPQVRLERMEMMLVMVARSSKLIQNQLTQLSGCRLHPLPAALVQIWNGQLRLSVDLVDVFFPVKEAKQRHVWIHFSDTQSGSKFER